ncbi:hypothetical protein [Glutamicibacter sp. FBE19]|uniref:hypothetical protein n=1 Tax=Glutamicibacter sp. FBE19 TaxID=2761534 RepID=UPI0018966162|nr:hypothetical protein [Glutamicibacter sp. FBE19]MBF6672427.1 hypothetical protein [Glutamicibacter sp. FBE19]
MNLTFSAHQQKRDTNGQRSIDAPTIEKGRDALAKVNVAAPTNYPEKEPVMSNVTNFPQPPAGFKLEYFCSCGAECPPNDPMEPECETIGHSYVGPGVHLGDASGCQVNSSWSASDGIRFLVSNHGYTSDADDAPYVEKTWTREQLKRLPQMIEQVLSKIDYEAAKQFFERHPEHFQEAVTVQELARLAHENNLDTPQTFQAYMDIYNKRGINNA